MARCTQTLQAILDEVARGGGRSSLFWFLVKHHDELMQQAEGKRFRWEALCQRFAEHGLTDARGEAASPKTARQTWLRARKVVAESKRRKQASDTTKRPETVHPSRISPDWQAKVVTPRAVAPTSQPASSSRAILPSGRKSLVDPNDHPLVQEQMARLDAIFEEDAKGRLPGWMGGSGAD